MGREGKRRRKGEALADNGSRTEFGFFLDLVEKEGRMGE